MPAPFASNVTELTKCNNWRFEMASPEAIIKQNYLYFSDN